MKQKRYWVIQRVVEYSPVPEYYKQLREEHGYLGIMFCYRTKDDAVRANCGSRKDVVCYYVKEESE